MSGRMTDSASTDSLLSIAAPLPHRRSLAGDSHRDLPKPVKKRPVTQHTDTESPQSTDVEDRSSPEGHHHVAASSSSSQGKKRPYQSMSSTIDDVHGEPGYFNMTLVR